MFITLRKKNIMLVMVLVLAVGFLFVSIKNVQRDTPTLNELVQEHLENRGSQEIPDEDLEVDDTTPMPVLGNPLGIGTQIEVPIKVDYFMDYKLERDRIRSRQIDLLREIVNNPNSVTDNRMEAQQRLFTISDNLEQELELESLLAAKGYFQTAVLIQPTAVTIVVGKSEIGQEDIARISDIAVKTTEYKLEDVIIIPLQEKSS